MMSNNWSCRRLLLPAAISFLTLLFAGPLAPGAPAADAPAWLHNAARETYPNVPPETKAVILFDETEVTVQPNGQLESTYRRAILILRPGGKELGQLVVPFDNETKITWVKAWCIPKDGKDYEVKEKDFLEIGSLEEFYSDHRAKAVTIPAALPGNVIGYEYHQKSRPFILQDEWRFQDRIPVRQSRFSVSLPAGWQFANYWINYPSQKSISDSSTLITWNVENIPAIKSEPSMPDWRAVAARMAVTYHPPQDKGSALGPITWDQIGVWYSQLSSGSIQPTLEIQQKVKELTANAATWRDKVRVLAGYVQSRIRYVDIEIGIGGFQPHSAGDIFKHQYGDCKDKATLLSAMLHEVGIPSYLALAQTERGVVNPEFASAITFNHVILAIPLPADVPTQGFTAVVDSSKLGKLFFFDPTSEYTPFGYLPTYEQENFVLVATPKGGELIRLPLAVPETNRLIRTGKLELHPDGSLTGSVNEVSYGSLASNERERLLGSNATDRTKALEAFLGAFLRGFHLTQASTENIDSVNEPLTLKYQFTADRYAKAAGDLLILRPRVIGEKARNVAEGDDPRKFAVEFEASSLETDDFEITLPAGFTVDDLPLPTKTETEFGSYVSQIQVTGGKIHYTRTFQLKKVLVPLEKMDELRKFNRQIAADERANIVLKRAQ